MPLDELLVFILHLGIVFLNLLSKLVDLFELASPFFEQLLLSHDKCLRQRHGHLALLSFQSDQRLHKLERILLESCVSRNGGRVSEHGLDGLHL